MPFEVYLPAVHIVHAAEPLAEKLPAAHVAQVVEPGLAEYCPGSQALHTDTSVEPIVVEKVPAGHAVQVAVPLLLANLPALQVVQTVAPTSLLYPGEHCKQDIDPPLLA